ncbi:MAG: hypothetical protein R2912_11585 [Eubacteriales bacterium]
MLSPGNQQREMRKKRFKTYSDNYTMALKKYEHSFAPRLTASPRPNYRAGRRSCGSLPVSVPRLLRRARKRLSRQHRGQSMPCGRRDPRAPAHTLRLENAAIQAQIDELYRPLLARVRSKLAQALLPQIGTLLTIDLHYSRESAVRI